MFDWKIEINFFIRNKHPFVCHKLECLVSTVKILKLSEFKCEPASAELRREDVFGLDVLVVRPRQIRVQHSRVDDEADDSLAAATKFDAQSSEMK